MPSESTTILHQSHETSCKNECRGRNAARKPMRSTKMTFAVQEATNRRCPKKKVKNFGKKCKVNRPQFFTKAMKHPVKMTVGCQIRREKRCGRRKCSFPCTKQPIMGKTIPGATTPPKTRDQRYQSMKVNHGPKTGLAFD